MKLLIVDDNKSMRHLIRSVVAAPDDVVSECAAGIDVEYAYQTNQPDVVLMDLQMPKVNGITATRNLKKKYPNANVIIVSNFKDQEFQDEARDAGASSYFTKDDLLQLKSFIHQKAH